MSLVDLRSDTVTLPTPEMRKAMADAEVGDDAYGEDPTVAELEALYASRVGKEAAVFVPSGMMANQIAIRLHTRPGQLLVAGRRSHVIGFENGAAAKNSGVQLYPLDDERGAFSVADLRWAVEAGSHHQPQVGLVSVEDTVMAADGAVWPLDALSEVWSAARAAGLPVHLDGARLWNAEVASGTSMAARAAGATTVMSCLSKGLCAPVGSLLAGTADDMARARVERHHFGGAMRQSGVLAAAGLVAMRTMVGRLFEDHRRARRLAEALVDRGVVPDRIATNIVTVPIPDPGPFLDHLRSQGILVGTVAPGVVRFVTHGDIDDAGIERAMSAIASAP